MRITEHLPSALLLLLQTVNALPYQSAGESNSDALLTKRIVSAVESGNQSSVLSGLLADKPKKPAPTTEAELQASLSAIWSSSDTNFYAGVKAQIDSNISISGLSADIVGPYTYLGSTSNNHPKDPTTSIYPQKSTSDAPYSISEHDLRSAIFVPASFTYGQRPPLIFIPGTGTYGGEAFTHNLLKLLNSSPFADPVFLNVPGALLGDAQTHAEYVAYAINYISGISSAANLSIITWSQGGLDAQWAFTFWPSTRAVVSDFVAVSPDFHGTVLAPALCLSPGKETDFNPCPPAVIQQEYDSRFVAALRAKGGADAYVPTTTVYSGVFDEIVEPQQGVVASAFLRDGRGVGVANVEAQVACLGRPAGSFYGHAGMLFSPLTAALAVDALSHSGPADLGRIDLKSVCESYVAPGLTVGDATLTAGQIVTAAVRLLAYQPRLTKEPELRSYAT
ncbi:Alpha/beta-hydrolase [Coniochaeta hoffmannii]|uniref:Alpha/beta-hydrolase n=1 Tax=Coniochaeta hoffmannii TaxID=91930 RepID=A0AA38RUU2_9PEZI|nr:Alpha/beta-hydrolase [Coniochaeta hoffmannii]